MTNHGGVMDIDPYDIDNMGLPPLPPIGGRDSSSREPIPKIGSRARMPECKCEQCQVYNTEHQIYVPLTFGTYDDLNPRDEDAFFDHKFFLCDSHLHAFMLKDRVWGE